MLSSAETTYEVNNYTFPVCVWYVCVRPCVSIGQVTGLQRGPTTEKWEYDGQGRIVSRVFADGKTWSYTYLDKVRATGLLSGKPHCSRLASEAFSLGQLTR